MEGLGRFRGPGWMLAGLGARRTGPGRRRAGGTGSGQSGWAERRPGPPEPPLLLSSGCGGDRSARVTGGLPSVWELPLQLLWQPGPNPTLFTSCEEIQNGWGLCTLMGFYLSPLHRDGGWAVSGSWGKEEWKRFSFPSPIWLSWPQLLGGWGGKGGVFGGALAQTPHTC